MENFLDLEFLLPGIVGLFWAIVFMQSGFDKVFDWKGNLSWLESHFKDSPIEPFVKILLGVLTIFELIAGLLSFVGVGIYLQNGDRWWMSMGLLFSMFSLLMLIFGQRVNKDYDGAKTIAIYFAVALVSGLILI